MLINMILNNYYLISMLRIVLEVELRVAVQLNSDDLRLETAKKTQSVI